MSPAASPPDPLLGRLLGGRFRIEGELARGGMATVYRAVDRRLERPVAVKVLAAPYAEQPAYVERFLAEARVVASLSHPRLAHVYDSGSDGANHYLVFELLERHRSLRAELRERGRLAPLEAVGIALDVLAGLEQLHALALVHCDVKPGNVMIGEGGTKLIDFGIARPLDEPMGGATSIGSLHAMSPEQLRGERLTPSSDLFAVGVLLYECLTGTVPFPGGTPDEVAAAHQRGPAGPASATAPDVVARLDDVVRQALRIDPERRFASASAMATALQTAAAAQRDAAARFGADDDTTTIHVAPLQTTTAPRPAAGRSRSPRGPWLAIAAGVTLVTVVAASVLLLGFPQAGGSGAATPTPSPSASAAAEPSLAQGMVRVPSVLGMTEAEAQAAAEAAGLAWRIEWRIVPGREPGVYAQEPEPDMVVRDGSAFVMQAYRDR